MIASLESVENARSMHEQGMQELRSADYGQDIHPISALAVVHNVLLMPLDNGEKPSLQVAFAILDGRLRQPDALKWRETPSLPRRTLESFQLAFVAVHPPEQVDTAWNQHLWVPAMKAIQRPIDDSEIGTSA